MASIDIGYKQFVGQGQAFGGQVGSAPLGPVNAPSRPSRLDSVTEHNMRNVESLVGLIEKLRAIRVRFIGDITEDPNQKLDARASKSGHVGKLEDQAEGVSYGLAQCHEIVSDLLNL